MIPLIALLFEVSMSSQELKLLEIDKTGNSIVDQMLDDLKDKKGSLTATNILLGVQAGI